MTRTTSARRLLLLAVVAALAQWAAACDHAAPLPPSAPSPTPESKPSVTLTLEGSTSIEGPGETTRLVAIIRSADGTTTDVTALGEWRVSNPRVIRMVSPGVFQALAYGAATVTYSRLGLSVTAAARVAPAGAFILSGAVTQFNDTPLAGTTVEVTARVGQFTAVTSASGAYWLPAAGQSTVRAERAGEPLALKTWDVGADANLVVLVLRPGAGGASGTYALTFTASSTCRTGGRWVYEIDMEEWQGRLLAIAQGERFVALGAAGFTGTRNGDDVRFSISSACSFGDAPCFNDGGLGFDGVAAGAIRGDTIAATLAGAIGTCNASDHRMELTRVPYSAR